MRIFLHPHEDTAVSWYRLVQFMKYLGHHKKAEIHSVMWTGDMSVYTVETEVYDREGEWADIFFTTAAKSQQQCAYFMAIRDRYKLKMVVDIDDNLTQINQDHPNWLNLRENDAAGWAQLSMQYADLVTVTQPYLAELYATVNKNFYINPNAVDLKDWSRVKPEKHDTFRIGWTGAAGHEGDLAIIKRFLPTIKKMYNVEFVTMGQKPISLISDRHLGWSPMATYVDDYCKAGFDLILAPLRDNAYNRGKSNLRLIEATAAGIPVIASPVGPYSDFPCPKAKETDDWVTQISKLIENDSERKQAVETALKEVKEKYEIGVTSKALLKRFQKLKESKWTKGKFQT